MSGDLAQKCTECGGEGAIYFSAVRDVDGNYCEAPSSERCEGCAGTGLEEVQWLGNQLASLRAQLDAWRPVIEAAKVLKREYEATYRPELGELNSMIQEFIDAVKRMQA